MEQGKRRNGRILAGITLSLPVALCGVHVQAVRAHDKAILNRIMERAVRLSRECAPYVQFVSLDATPLAVVRPGGGYRKVWSVQVSDRRGEYVGETLWDAETGEITSSAWRGQVHRPSDGNRLSLREARELAMLSVVQMEDALIGAEIRTLGPPRQERGVWTLWFDTSVGRFRVRVDSATGHLIAAERRGNGGPECRA